MFGHEEVDLSSLSHTSRVLERMVSQNIYDEVMQGNPYFEIN